MANPTSTGPLVCAVTCAVLLQALVGDAQRSLQPGRSIGKVSTQDNLIILELDEGVLGKSNLFDLVGRTLRFVPDKGGYRVENTPLAWDQDSGAEAGSPEVSLGEFAFPFSGKTWRSFSVGITGSIRFAAQESSGGRGGPGIATAQPGGGGRGGGISIGRFDQLGEAAGTLVNRDPAICVFFKPRMSGARYVKKLADRVVITWDVTEPYGNIQDFTWDKTVNRFQAVLHRDGTIDMAYLQLAAKDAIVGVYPLVTSGGEKTLATIGAAETPGVAAHLDLRSVKLSVVDGVFLKATLETRGPVLREGDEALAGIVYRVHLSQSKPSSGSASAADAEVVWTIRGFAPRARGGNGSSRYVASGAGVDTNVKANGNTISLQGVLPAQLHGDQLSVYAEAAAGGNGSPESVDRISSRTVGLAGIHGPEVDLSSLRGKDGPFPVVYESFHYLALPNPRDLTCTVIEALGDKFAFLAYYSDFRIDNQEAGTPSTGPRGGNVTAIGRGQDQRGLEDYCSQGEFQWQFVQPVYVGSNQMQEQPPPGAPLGNDHDVTFYARQLGERSLDGKMLPYNYAMSQIGHEMGHRWSAFLTAKVNGETIQLGPTHWARGLHAPAAFPYQRAIEASAMGGGVWQDNLDGTYTQLDDDYYVPATGWSHLDLFLMGLISAAEVPDFFILRNLEPAGRDANGHRIFKAERTRVTIQDVIAAEGERKPDVSRSQRDFNTGMVLVVEHGQKPSPELIERVNGIRRQWIEYWTITTGGRSKMTATPNVSRTNSRPDEREH
jgi:hypothetical protein